MGQPVDAAQFTRDFPEGTQCGQLYRGPLCDPRGCGIKANPLEAGVLAGLGTGDSQAAHTPRTRLCAAAVADALALGPKKRTLPIDARPKTVYLQR